MAKIRYQVLENGVPCDAEHQKAHPSWKTSIFDTFEEAQKYANKWLGMYGGVTLELNKSWDYTGYGDYIVIAGIDGDSMERNLTVSFSPRSNGLWDWAFYLGKYLVAASWQLFCNGYVDRFAAEEAAAEWLKEKLCA